MLGVMKMLEENYPGLQGVLVAHMDFWMQVTHIIDETKFDHFWQAGSGLGMNGRRRAQSPEANRNLVGPYCIDWDVVKNEDDGGYLSQWQWYSGGKPPCKNAVHKSL